MLGGAPRAHEFLSETWVLASAFVLSHKSEGTLPNLSALKGAVSVGVKLWFIEPYPVNRVCPQRTDPFPCEPFRPFCHGPLSAVTSGGGLEIVPVACFARKSSGETITRAPLENFVFTGPTRWVSSVHGTWVYWRKAIEAAEVCHIQCEDVPNVVNIHRRCQSCIVNLNT